MYIYEINNIQQSRSMEKLILTSHKFISQKSIIWAIKRNGEFI